jgi:hypothetical protein
MPEYLTESVSISRHLRPGETLEVEVSVPNPGQIVAIASARWDRIFPVDPTKRLLEIFKPNLTTPVASRLDEGLAIKTFLSQSAGASDTGVWKARVTNRENAAETFTLTLSYPGTTLLRTISVPVSLIDAFVNNTVGQISIHLTNGTNSSYIRFPTSMNVPEEHFTLPSYRHTFDLPWPIPNLTVSERVSDINSQSVNVTLGNTNSDFMNGFINMNVAFETAGREIQGTVDANVSHMNLTVNLGLMVENRRITYQTETVDVSFPITIDLVNIPDFIEDLVNGFTGFRNQIRTAVINAIRNVFVSNATRQALTNALNTQLRTLLGANAQIVTAKVESGNLTIKYYNT